MSTEETVFHVVVNDEEQYSIWAAGSPPPDGWYREGTTGTRQDCLNHIERVWTDITPRSVREAAARAANAS
ncbi:MbtH family protein [Streptomyces eurythermus]|uniref:MbtH family NRPS accessory protein n=1 Tax=Streptomyces flaveolus TaxID=67297 RepID=A0ABV3AD78_9ACTN